MSYLPNTECKKKKPLGFFFSFIEMKGLELWGICDVYFCKIYIFIIQTSVCGLMARTLHQENAAFEIDCLVHVVLYIYVTIINWIAVSLWRPTLSLSQNSKLWALWETTSRSKADCGLIAQKFLMSTVYLSWVCCLAVLQQEHKRWWRYCHSPETLLLHQYDCSSQYSDLSFKELCILYASTPDAEESEHIYSHQTGNHSVILLFAFF